MLHRETQSAPNGAGSFLPAEGLPREEWTRAVVKGADDKSSRWKHLLVIGGLLTGFEAQEQHGLSSKLREYLEHAVVTATNLTLQECSQEPELDSLTMVLVLSHCFDLLSPTNKASIDTEGLLPVLVKGILFSREGLHWGYFLGAMDSDIVQDHDDKFNWSPKSNSFYQAQTMATGPIVSALGVLSRVTAFCVGSVGNVDLLYSLLEDLTVFTRSFSVQWRQNKLSELDMSEEGNFLAEEALRQTMPMLWQVLRSSLFAIVVILSGITSRILWDRGIVMQQVPLIAAQVLHILRNLYFISSRIGHNSLSQYNFVYTAAVDILSKYPLHAEKFLRDVQPTELGRIPDHPYERCQDLFFLNAAENFTLDIPPELSEELLLAAAAPYLGTGGDVRLNEIFEAAHSVFLAVFSGPQNLEITTRLLPIYLGTLFQVFPERLSARQFRLAVKTLVRTSSPPLPLSETQPLLSTTILEMVHNRATTSALDAPLPSLPSQDEETIVVSERSALVLALIDSLPSLTVVHLDEWLSLTAQAMNSIQDPTMRESCKQRFWDVISNGEMDVLQSQFCVAWWNNHGGRNLVLDGDSSILPEDKGPYMSGALGNLSKL